MFGTWGHNVTLLTPLHAIVFRHMARSELYHWVTGQLSVSLPFLHSLTGAHCTVHSTKRELFSVKTYTRREQRIFSSYKRKRYIIETITVSDVSISSFACYAHRHIKLGTAGGQSRVRELGSIEFYRAVHLSAICAVLGSHVVRLSVSLSVRLSVCDVGGLWSHRLEILETNCRDN